MGLRVRCQVRVEDGRHIVDEIHKVVVHRFKMSDVEDPDIYVAEPIWKWQQTDAGKFVMENAIGQPEWHYQRTSVDYGFAVAIVAELHVKKLSEFYLKWGKPDGNN